jgi:hypothetical protein
VSRTIAECLAAAALVGGFCAVLSAQHAAEEPRPVTQSYVRARLGTNAGLLVATVDVGIEALFTDAMALSAMLNDRRWRLLGPCDKEVQQRMDATRRSLVRATGPEYRQALQALAGVKFVDVFGPRAVAREVETELCLWRTSMEAVPFAQGALGALSKIGAGLWGNGSGSVAEGGGFSPLAQGSAALDAKVEAWFDSLAAGPPDGVVPKLVQLVLRLDGGDRKRARAMVTAMNGWWPDPFAARGMLMWGPDAMWVPDSLCVEGAREDWLALQSIDEELCSLFAAVPSNTLGTARVDAERWFRNTRGNLPYRESVFAAAAEFTASPVGPWLSSQQCRRLRGLWHHDFWRACAQPDGNPVFAAVASPLDVGGRKAQRFLWQPMPADAPK